MSDPDQPAPLTSAQVQAWLGSPRFARYTGAAGGAEPVALRLYQWNAQMAAAALVDVGHFEVALRNAVIAQRASLTQLRLPRRRRVAPDSLSTSRMKP